jgi:hypothetical protein
MLQNYTPVIRLINGIRMMVIKVSVKEDSIINIVGLCQVQGRIQWQGFVSTVINLWITYKQGIS